MKTIEKRAQAEIVVKKSRFIATLAPALDKQEAEAFVAEMKKKYWDARHNCSAYILPPENAGDTMYVHSSDDGEPSGTAGKPMLSVLQGAEICGAVVVVTRYFGGVLLGTGGLVRAYQDAVSEAIKEAELFEQRNVKEVNITLDYTLWGKLENLIRQHEDIVADEPIYGEKVSIRLLFPSERSEQYTDMIVQAVNGKAEINTGDETTVNVPVK